MTARCEAAEAANRVLVEECDALKVSMQTMSPDEALREQITLCENAQRRLGDAEADAERLAKSLDGMIAWMEQHHPKAAENIPNTRATLAAHRAQREAK